MNTSGTKTQITRQTFSALVPLMDADQTTDVLLLKKAPIMAPIALASVEGELTLEPMPLDTETVLDESPVRATLLNQE